MKSERINGPACLALALLLAGSASGQTTLARRTTGEDLTQRTILRQHVLSRLAQAKDLGEADAALELDPMLLTLPPSAEQESELARLLEDQRNPASPQFHKWLSSADYGTRFGLASEDIQEVQAWLESQGLHVLRVANARNWIQFTGRAGQVSQAFGASIHRFNAGGDLHYANVSNPQIPARFRTIVAGIRGLHDFHPRPGSRPKPHYIDANGYSYYAPADIANIYNLKPLYNAGIDGAGITIAIAGQSDFALADIQAFRTLFNLPTNDPQTVLDGIDPGQGDLQEVLEADLDIEWAGAIAPKATIKYVVSRDAWESALYAIDNQTGSIISFSYGDCENDVTGGFDSSRTAVQQANASGITFVAASGDAGPAACDWTPPNPESFATHGLAVSVPASIPEVTAVGGTMAVDATYGQNAAVKSSIAMSVEQAWNDYGIVVATGGGPSHYYPKPPWQIGPGVQSDGFRDVPDIALLADPQYAFCHQSICQTGQLDASGGTSASAPVAAGILALIAEYQANKNGSSSSLGNVNPTLYLLAPNSPLAIRDVSEGTNLVPCEAGTVDCPFGSFGYAAGPGYDLATGLGSLDGYNLATSWQFASSRIPTTVTIAQPAGSCMNGQSAVVFTATVTASVGAAAAPSGTVNFYSSSSFDGTLITLLGSAQLVASGTLGTATLQISNANLFSVAVTAIYSGDATFAGMKTMLVYGTPTYLSEGAIILTASTNVLAVGTPLVLTAQVANSCGSNAADSLFLFQGVSYEDNTTAVADANGTATVTFTNLIPGVYPLTVRDLGVTNVPSNTVNVVVLDPTNLPGTLQRIAGGRHASYSGDGGVASSAGFENPVAVAVDSQTNKYILDAQCACIRKIDASGTITTIIGGTQPVADGQFVAPTNLAVDKTGMLYVSDLGRVSKIVAGHLVTVAGTGTCANYSGEGGPATAATICPANGIALDAAGNLYIADAHNYRVYEVSALGVITTVAGTGAAPLPQSVDLLPLMGTPIQPEAIAATPQGLLYLLLGGTFSNTRNSIYMIGSDGLFHALGQGCCAPVELNVSALTPTAIALDPNGNLLVASADNRLVKITGATFVPLAGNLTAGIVDSADALLGEVNAPDSLAADANGNIFFTDAGDPVVQELTPATPLSSEPLRFVPVQPCRLADTRNPSALFGGTLTPALSQDFPIPQSNCGIPSNAKAYSLNVTAVPLGPLGYLTVWPTNQPQPFASTLNSDGRVKSNAVIVPAGDNGAISAYASDKSDLVLDINGYFVPAADPTALAFYPLPPCRVADTRAFDGDALLGSLAKQETRTFPVVQSPCNVPAPAKAYSLNFSAIPKRILGFLSAWPTGAPQPYVSTLNSYTGTITANAAIVPAGSGGSVDVYVSDAADIFIDINGYFAAPDARVGGLSLYAANPCRVFDSRSLVPGQPIDGSTIVDFSASGCPLPAFAQAFILNATVVPTPTLGFLTLWPDLQGQPLASVLNSFDGSTDSNLAIVPTTNGKVDAYTSNPSHLILDLLGYFAP